LARIILSHALLESIRFVMSRKERRDIYGLINTCTFWVTVPTFVTVTGHCLAVPGRATALS
jgi:hypothetical protein